MRDGGTAGRLDFDDVGAEVAENLAAEQAAFGGEIEHSASVEHGAMRYLVETLAD